MKKVILSAILLVATTVCAMAQDQNAYFANFKRHHSLEEMQDFSDLHAGMTKQRCLKDLTAGINKMLNQIGTPIGGQVRYIDDQGGIHYLKYFDEDMTLDVIENANHLAEAPTGTVTTVGWRAYDRPEWFTRDQKIINGCAEKFMYLNVGNYYGIECLRSTKFLFWSDVCGNPTVLIKQSVPSPEYARSTYVAPDKEGEDGAKENAGTTSTYAGPGTTVNNNFYGYKKDHEKKASNGLGHWCHIHPVAAFLIGFGTASAIGVGIYAATGGFNHPGQASAQQQPTSNGNGTTNGTGGPANVVTIP